MKRENTDAFALRDFEVALKTKRETKIITVRKSTSKQKAEERVRRNYGKDVVSIKVLRCVAEHAPKAVPLAELSAATEGKRYVLRDSFGRLSVDEDIGGHAQTAWGYLTRNRVGSAWKTARVLVALRNAIQADSDSASTEDLLALLATPTTEKRVLTYIARARKRDVQRHGTHTF